MRTTTLSLLGALLATAIAGCCCPPQRCCPCPCPDTRCRPVLSIATAGTTSVAVHPAPSSGGLLGDTSAFGENPERPGTYVWTKPGVDLRSYDDILIEEIRLQPAPGSAFAALPAAKQQAAAAAFHATLVKTVAPYYDVVATPGAHTLRVRVALVSQPAADGTGDASLEVELLDGQRDERLVAALGRLGMSERDAIEDVASASERAQRAWAARLLRYLDTHVK